MRKRHFPTRLTILFFFFGAALLAALPSRRALSSGDGACAASPAVRAEIASIERTWNIDTDPEFRHRLEALRALAERAPTDVEAHIAYQDSRNQGQRDFDTRREQYRRLREEAPDSALYAFLYARLLPPKDALPIARDLTGNHPGFPWGHLLAASLEDRRGARRDEAVIRKHLARFQSLCPDSPAPYRLLSTLHDPEVVLASARSLRVLLEPDENLAKHYPTLWSLEFKSVPIAEHPKIRDRVRRDLARLTPLLANDLDASFLVILAGFDLIEDVEERRRAEETTLKAWPGSFVALQIVIQRFERQNPEPRPGEPAPKRASYFRALFDASTEWTSRWRDYPEAWLYRLGAIRELEEVPDEDAIRTGEGLLAALRKRPCDVSSALYPFPIRIGELWLSRGIRLQEVNRLADFSETNTEERLWASARGTPEDFKGVLEEVRWLGQPLRVEASALLGKLDEAQRVLAEMEGARPASFEGADDGDRMRLLSRAALIERARAGISAAEGKTTEALALYRKAALLFPAEWRNQPVPAECLRRTRQLFRRQAGTLEGFDAWLAKGETIVPAVSALAGFEKRGRKLPAFELRSVDGKLWRLADLKRKKIFINIWATWCGYCMSELPYVQRLHDRLRKRRDVLLLTFDVDDNVGPVAPFLKREKYSFPVLFAKEYVTDFSEGGLSLPRSWIVSKDGVLELELQGFSSGESTASWTEKVERLIDSLDAPPSPSPRPQSPSAPRTSGTPARFP
jgi:thiol-disulfide isomerase/thioredoxin